jgi:uncharacterized protein YneF (UPF0154 family)
MNELIWLLLGISIGISLGVVIGGWFARKW